jgi:hypothetical protein
MPVDGPSHGHSDQVGDPWEQRREQLRAESLLTKMDVFEEFAAKASDSNQTDGAFWDRKTAESYRRAIGVEPSQRARLREGLEAIRDSCHRRVADLVDDLARRRFED